MFIFVITGKADGCIRTPLFVILILMGGGVALTGLLLRFLLCDFWPELCKFLEDCYCYNPCPPMATFTFPVASFIKF